MDCRASASLAERKMVAFPRAPNLNLIHIRNPIPIRDSMITTPPTAQSHRSLIETPATPPTAPPRFFCKTQSPVRSRSGPPIPSVRNCGRARSLPDAEVKKINREPNWCSIFKCNHHLRCRLRAKKHFMQTFLGGDYVVGRALVGREITNQL